MTVKRISTFILTFAFVFSWVAPSYGASRCENIFFVDLEAVYKNELKQLIKSHYSVAQEQVLISNLFLKLGMRQFKMKSMETPRDIRRAISETEHLFQVASKFSGEYTELSPEMRWFEREVLARGIDSLILKYRDVPERNVVLKLIRKIFKSRLVKFAQNFRNLPYRNDKVMPEELFEKIMRDGVVAHEKELLENYDSLNQDRIDQYRQIRKIYSTFFILLLSYTAWEKLENVDEEVTAAKLKSIHKALEDLDQFANALNEELSRRDLYKD